MTHHWVELMQGITGSLYFLNGQVHILSQCCDIFRIGRNELMQRRIQVTNCHRTSLKSLVHSLEVSLLELKKLC